MHPTQNNWEIKRKTRIRVNKRERKSVGIWMKEKSTREADYCFGANPKASRGLLIPQPRDKLSLLTYSPVYGT